MRVICFDIESQTANLFNEANKYSFDMRFTDSELNASTVYACEDFDVVVLLSRNYRIDDYVFQSLKKYGVSLIVTTPSSIQNLNVKAFASAQIHVAKLDVRINPQRILNSIHAILDHLALDQHPLNSDTKMLFNDQSQNEQPKIGLIGFNDYGQKLATQLIQLGFTNLFYYDPEVIESDLAKPVELDDLLESCSIISYQSENPNLPPLFFDNNFFSKVKAKPFILNNSGLRNEQILAIDSAYKTNLISGYARNFINNSSFEQQLVVTNKVNVPWVVNRFSFEFESSDALREVVEQTLAAIYEFGTTARTKTIID
ncbi:Rossmann-fold NAD(P)-binding domain-containing protein [[Mycoplasma] testudinis]|uniref:hypothetical protein n=1 Tax=[Mycoplasma] testudinis TaxID=33924 RepID=UPI000484A003|nr:hypothetical protein [[Mycoplasma] testudinis]